MSSSLSSNADTYRRPSIRRPFLLGAAFPKY
jgi:hypothetical protein